MQGLVMDIPLTLTRILQRSEQYFPRKRIITRIQDGYHSYTYEEFSDRVRRLANALLDHGIRPGDRVATFAWNHYRHVELYFAVPCIGAVLHTVNIRLSPEQTAYIINHADDRFVFVDDSLLPALDAIADDIRGVERFVVMTDGDLPETHLEPVIDYEEFTASADRHIEWPGLDERAACVLCYTSGTTGNPKGVAYSHRAMVLHTMAVTTADVIGLTERDRCQMIVPLFHANAWGLPFAATMVGADQVLPNRYLSPHDLAAMIEDQRVTYSAGVPTIWVGMLQDLEEHDYDLSSLRMITGGGSAVPESLIRGFAERGVDLIQGWGMTETGPVASLSRVKSDLEDLPQDDRMKLRAKQGLALPLIELRVVANDGTVQPWDGKSQGEIQIRGPWVASGYFDMPEATDGSWSEGWLKTGDVGVIDSDGYMQLLDRKKDVIKSGGEWISSVDLENAMMGYDKIAEAAVIAVAHPEWQERPLACVVPKSGEKVTTDEINSFLEGKVPKWWLPDDVVIVDEIPKTSVGKFDKKVLRERFADYELPTA